MKYEMPDAREWVQPIRQGYKMSCCDCGLVHRMNFRLATWGKKRNKIQFQVFRDDRATGAIRRWMK